MFLYTLFCYIDLGSKVLWHRLLLCFVTMAAEAALRALEAGMPETQLVVASSVPDTATKKHVFGWGQAGVDRPDESIKR